MGLAKFESRRALKRQYSRAKGFELAQWQPIGLCFACHMRPMRSSAAITRSQLRSLSNNKSPNARPFSCSVSNQLPAHRKRPSVPPTLESWNKLPPLPESWNHDVPESHLSRMARISIAIRQQAEAGELLHVLRLCRPLREVCEQTNSRPSIEVFHAILLSLAQHAQFEAAIETIKDMFAIGLKPDLQCFNSVLQVSLLAGSYCKV